jgi:hypothetical protein
MTSRRARGSIVCASLCATLFIPVATTAMQEESDRVVVDDPRPLAAAVLEIERRCRCVVTYEDVRWISSQVEPAAHLSGRPGALRAHVPKGRPLTVTLPRKMDPAVTGDMAAALHAVLQAFEQTGSPGAFRAVSTPFGFHILPADHALFDVRITLPSRTRSVAEALPEVLAGVAVASGNRILVGRVPVNLLMRTTTDGGASDERFGDVLARLLASTGRPMSWRLLYDFGMKAYYLNVHGVQSVRGSPAKP